MSLSMIELSTGSTSTGGAGASTATATTTSPIHGTILAVYVQYLGSPPAGTTDITLKTTGTASGAPPTMTILAITNAATDGWFRPRVPEHLSTTGAVIADSYDWPVVMDTLTLLIEGANDGDGVKVWIQFEGY